MIKAIDTVYNGYRFRSRLEARWAVFLYELGWSYEYEKEGFILSDGTKYLPDFWIQGLNSWLEVKPQMLTQKDRKLSREFSKSLNNDQNVILVNGLPAKVQYECYCKGNLIGGVTLSTYIKTKGWGVPYFGGDWWEHDERAFKAAVQKRFEFEEYDKL